MNTDIPAKFKDIVINSTEVVDKIFDYHQEHKVYIDDNLEYSYMLLIKKFKIQVYFKERLIEYRKEYAKDNVQVKRKVEVKEDMKIYTQPQTAKKKNKNKKKKKEIKRAYAPFDAKVLGWSKDNEVQREPLPNNANKTVSTEAKSDDKKIILSTQSEVSHCSISYSESLLKKSPETNSPKEVLNIVALHPAGKHIKREQCISLETLSTYNIPFSLIKEISKRDFAFCFIYKKGNFGYSLDFYNSQRDIRTKYERETICIKKVKDKYYITTNYYYVSSPPREKIKTFTSHNNSIPSSKKKKKKTGKKNIKRAPYVKIISTPMGGMNKRY